MPFQVLARKWRPQSFDAVVGQQVVTRSLRNALASGRIAQAFVFAGPRGVGKTTTARILARALNCERGPTADPCGTCDACIEIAEGRDIDVLEIDGATHTQVDTVREVIISGLSIAPVRNRYKVFIIDEVHQLSTGSFNALLKSIEEPPPHVVFMMATTELGKIPDTVLSRSQVYEFRTISTRVIAEQLRRIADAERIEVGDDTLTLLARSAEGSMRDAQSAFDQVISFSGRTVATDDVSTVLGLVGRDLLFDMVQAVADENPAAALALAGRAVEVGHDLRHLCRDLSGLVRDLLVLSIDPSRIDDPEIAIESERTRLTGLARRFSREDLLRAFDVLARAETDIRFAAQPRYHLEMALLRWVHLQKLVPLADLLESVKGGRGLSDVLVPQKASPTPGAAPAAPGRSQVPGRSESPSIAPPSAVPVPNLRSVLAAAVSSASAEARPMPITPLPPPPAPAPVRPASPLGPVARPATQAPPDPPSTSGESRSVVPAVGNAQEDEEIPGVDAPGDPAVSAGSPAGFKDALLAEIRRGKRFLYNMVVAQAQKIEVEGDRVTVTFGAGHRTLRDQMEEKDTRQWLEAAAARVAGRRITIVSTVAADTQAVAAAEPAVDPKGDLKAAALSDANVQAVLDIFAADIQDVEEL